MNKASYSHHIFGPVVLDDKAKILAAQYDAAMWHQTMRYNLDILGGSYADNAKPCQEYTQGVTRAVRVALGVQE